MRVHKLNTEYIAQELDRIEHEPKKKRRGGVNYHKWHEGDNIVRIGPPWSAKGQIAKKKISHFNLPPDMDNLPCMFNWPEKFDFCYICDVIEKLHKQYPGLIDLGRQEPQDNFQCNLLDREEENLGFQVGNLNPRLHNWVMHQIGDRRIGDITDVMEGFDIKVTKTVTKKRGKENTRYSETLMPRPCTLHEDEAVMEVWLDAMNDLDAINEPPDDAFLADIQTVASAMYKYYVGKNSRHSASEVRRRVTDDDFDKNANDDPTTSRSSSSSSSRVSGTGSVGGETSRGSSRDDSRRSIADQGKVDPKSEAQPPQRRTVTPEPKEKDLSGMPSCYCGHELPDAHENGSFGPDDNLDKCTFCEHEIQCKAEKMKKGI